MIAIDLLIVFTVVVLLIGIFGRGYEWRNWDLSLFFVFIFLFMATWAGGSWLTPIGEPFYGVYWLSYLFVGLFITLMLVAIFSLDASYFERYRYRRKRRRTRTDEELEDEELGCLFWIIIMIVMVPIIIYYL